MQNQRTLEFEVSLEIQRFCLYEKADWEFPMIP